MLHFTFVLAKNLKKTRGEIMRDMDANELVNWMAYEMTCDTKTRERLEKEISLENSRMMDDEQRAQAIKDMFKIIGR